MSTKSRVRELLKDRAQPIVHPSKCKGYDLVLGAGGVKGYAEIGAKQALDDLRVPICTVRGVSVGAGNAMLITNNRTPRMMLDLYEKERSRLFDASAWQDMYQDAVRAYTCALGGNMQCAEGLVTIWTAMSRKMIDTANFWQQAMTIPTPMQWMASQSFISLLKLWQDMIDREQLVPNDNLEIVAYCLTSNKPIYYKGSDYNLANAVAGSGALPGVFVPVTDGSHLLADGAKFHYNPTDGMKEPAIVIRLGRATEWPSEPLNFMDHYFHWREMYLPMMPTAHDVDETKHVVVDIPCEDVAGLAFGISLEKRLQLVLEGYRVTFETISKAIADGRIIIPSAAKEERV